MANYTSVQSGDFNNADTWKRPNGENGLKRALEQIAAVALSGESGYVDLDGKDAAGFIRIARRALGRKVPDVKR